MSLKKAILASAHLLCIRSSWINPSAVTDDEAQSLMDFVDSISICDFPSFFAELAISVSEEDSRLMQNTPQFGSSRDDFKSYNEFLDKIYRHLKKTIQFYETASSSPNVNLRLSDEMAYCFENWSDDILFINIYLKNVIALCMSLVAHEAYPSVYGGTVPFNLLLEEVEFEELCSMFKHICAIMELFHQILGSFIRLLKIASETCVMFDVNREAAVFSNIEVCLRLRLACVQYSRHMKLQLFLGKFVPNQKFTNFANSVSLCETELNLFLDQIIVSHGVYGKPSRVDYFTPCIDKKMFHVEIYQGSLVFNRVFVMCIENLHQVMAHVALYTISVFVRYQNSQLSYSICSLLLEFKNPARSNFAGEDACKEALSALDKAMSGLFDKGLTSNEHSYMGYLLLTGSLLERPYQRHIITLIAKVICIMLAPLHDYDYSRMGGLLCTPDQFRQIMIIRGLLEAIEVLAMDDTPHDLARLQQIHGALLQLRASWTD